LWLDTTPIASPKTPNLHQTGNRAASGRPRAGPRPPKRPSSMTSKRSRRIHKAPRGALVSHLELSFIFDDNSLVVALGVHCVIHVLHLEPVHPLPQFTPTSLLFTLLPSWGLFWWTSGNWAPPPAAAHSRRDEQCLSSLSHEAGTRIRELSIFFSACCSLTCNQWPRGNARFQAKPTTLCSAQPAWHCASLAE
jgi:hypothetical protein